MTKRIMIRTLALVALLSLALAGCGGTGGETTPTLSVEQIETQAVATHSAQLTSTALAMPTSTPTATGTSTPEATDTPAATQAASATPAGPAPTNTCYGMRYVSDVTIPDNTEMAPGEEFTKTWRVRNSGSCAWQAGFKFAFTGGEAMGGSTVSLANAVQPGAEVNLSVDLTAPTTPGTYRGNWRMSTAGGVFFGDEVFVLIVVESSAATATQGPSSTPTSTSTTAPTTAPTNTPEP